MQNWVALLMTFLAMPQAGWANASCFRERLKEMTDSFHGKKFQILEIPLSRKYDLKGIFGTDQPVLLGIENHGHYYLKVGEQTLEGVPFGHARLELDHGLRNGMVIHFPGLTPEIAHQWVVENQNKALKSRLSCVDHACGWLKDGFGIRIAGANHRKLLTSVNLKKILKNGFIDQNGNPVLFQIYRVTHHSSNLKKAVRKAQRMDAEQIANHLLLGALLSGVGGGIIFIAILDHKG